MTTVTGPERLFALEARSPAKPEALRLLEIEKTTNHSGRHLSRNQNNTSSEGAHLHLWCIAHRCAANLPLLSRRARVDSAAINCRALQASPRAIEAAREAAHGRIARPAGRCRGANASAQTHNNPNGPPRARSKTHNTNTGRAKRNHVQRHRRIGGN